jgi:WhiB family transcriptional regulator, redox-sensing transcriptional regulator
MEPKLARVRQRLTTALLRRSVYLRGVGKHLIPGGIGLMGRDDDRGGGYMYLEAQVDWRVRATCRDEDPDGLFVRGAEQRKAKLVCVACPVRTECLAEALDNRIEFGVWGGMTERERRALLRRRPEVDSWRELLDSARRDARQDAEEELQVG